MRKAPKPRLPVGGFLIIELTAVDLRHLAGLVQDGVVAVPHVLSPSEFRERRILPLPDVMQLVRITIRITRRITLPDQIGIIVVLPPVVIGNFEFPNFRKVNSPI